MTAPARDESFVPPPGGEFIGHPRPLWMLFGAEFWERFAYYGMRALLAVYVATAFFSALPAGEARAQASLTYGAYTALIYGTGIFGGFVADRYLGYRPSILLGGTLMAAGLFLLLIAELNWFLVGLAVIVVGNGLFKPNISAMVGQLYAPGRSAPRFGIHDLLHGHQCRRRAGAAHLRHPDRRRTSATSGASSRPGSA